MLRAREVKMLTQERIDRMLDAPGFDDASKLLLDIGYPDMSGMGMNQLDAILEQRRADLFDEISKFGYALDVLDLFRIKYDYHNIKVLVKSAGADIDASYLLSASGRIGAKILTDAFISGQFDGLPRLAASAINSATGILSRTGNPQLADIEIDKFYYEELSAFAKKLKDDFVTGYVKLLIDNANLRIMVRSARIGRNKDFLMATIIPGGSATAEQIATAFEDGTGAPFTDEALSQAVYLGAQVMKNGSQQTLFELACDNAVLNYITGVKYVSFGHIPVIAFFAKLEWEITVVRMILTGKYTGISPDVVRERLRDCHV